jgi:hypothetical protein
MSAAEARRIRLAMPFRGVTKTELVRRMLHDTHGAERLRVEDTLRACPSCYSATLPSGVTGCGQCMSCVRRWVAMSLNGIEERYVLNPWQRKLLQPNATWLRYVMRTPVRDWPGVLAVNQELWRAVRAATRRGL